MSTTITGNLKNLITGSIATNIFVRLWLRGTSGQTPRVDGTALIGPVNGTQYYWDFKPNASGVISGTVYSTRDSTGLLGGDIEVGGVSTAVWYGVQIFGNGIGGPEMPVHAKNGSTLDLTSVTPITVAPVVTAPTGDSTYARLDGGNQPFTGNIQAPGLTITGNASIGGTLGVTGQATLPLLNCKNIESSIFCIDTANTQGWAGADHGARINSAIAAWPSTGGQLLIASGVYNFTTPIVGAQDGTIICPVGPSTTGGRATLNYTPATGTAISWSNASIQLYGFNLTTSTSTTSIGILLSHVAQSSVDRIHINGFFGGLRVTGDGVSAFTVGMRISNCLIDGISALCTGGAGGYGVYFDHTTDLYYDKNEIYSANNCAIGVPMIIDTGATGIWLSGSTFEQGLNTGIIRNLNNGAAGGAYGGAPAAIFASGVSWDFSPGGDALLFDSTLGTADIKFFANDCWVAGGGRTNTGTIITATANGLNIQGGSNIHFMGGISRVNALWGVVINTGGQNISIEGMNIHANNQNNTAGVGGIQVTANPVGWRIINNRSGNIIEGGGNQAWGVDISATGASGGVISGNDFRNNSSGRIKMPAVGAAGQATVDAPEFGSTNGASIMGPLIFPEGTAPSGSSNNEACYGDSTSHTLKCSYNNGSFFTMPQVIANGTKALNTASITTATCDAGTAATATGTASTDTVDWSFNAAPTATNKYGAFLVVYAVPSLNTVTFYTCNPSATTSTPTAMTVNFSVRRP